MSIGLLTLLLPFGSVAIGLCCSVRVFQGDSPILLGEQEQPSALGCERPDLKGKTQLYAILPQQRDAFFTAKGQLVLPNTSASQPSPRNPNGSRVPCGTSLEPERSSDEYLWLSSSRCVLVKNESDLFSLGLGSELCETYGLCHITSCPTTNTLHPAQVI